MPTVCKEVAPVGERRRRSSAVPVMIRFTLRSLRLGFSKETSLLLEWHECGIGKCGRCNVGRVSTSARTARITLAELDKLTKEY